MARRRKATGMRWFVTKTIRYPTLPYGGPTWDVIDGKPRWFKTESAARKVAKEMTSYNPVGFSAAEIPAGWKAGKYPWFAPDNEERSNPMARRRKATGYVREKIRAHAARRNGDYSQTSDDELVEIYTGEKAGNREEALVEIKKRGVLDDYAIDLSLGMLPNSTYTTWSLKGT